MFLPVHLVKPRSIEVTAGVFSNTLMSPVEHSRKHRQRTGPRNKGPGMFVTGDVLAAIEVDVREVHQARERGDVA